MKKEKKAKEGFTHEHDEDTGECITSIQCEKHPQKNAHVCLSTEEEHLGVYCLYCAQEFLDKNIKNYLKK